MAADLKDFLASPIITSEVKMNVLSEVFGSVEEDTKSLFRLLQENKRFEIDLQSNRMGFRLKSDPISHTIPTELLSTAVTRGTLQLTPAGQLIVLMADHQTTGGYPRIGTVIGADMASMAQMPIGSSFGIKWIDIQEAERLLLQQETNLQQLENACKFRLQEYFSEK